MTWESVLDRCTPRGGAHLSNKGKMAEMCAYQIFTRRVHERFTRSVHETFTKRVHERYTISAHEAFKLQSKNLTSFAVVKIPNTSIKQEQFTL